MSKKTTASAAASSVIVEGMGEAIVEMTKAEKLERIKALQATKAGKVRAKEKAEKRLAKMVDLRDGTNESGQNAKLRHNPSLVPETLRPATDGEQINGHDAKGWVVSIKCETCGKAREINTQDAFQVRFCEEHKADAAKVASKARRAAKKDAELLAMSDEDLDAELTQLELQAA